MSPLFNIQGKTAVITGAAGVLCGEMVTALAKEGVKVALLDINEEKAGQLAEQIRMNGGTALPVKADILDKNSLVTAKDTVLKEFNRVDILINGAGGNKKEATAGDYQKFFEIPAEAIQWVFNLNLLGAILTTQVFGQVMAGQGDGVIINISSMNSFRPLTKVVAYSAAKAAINNFTQWLAVHMNQTYSSKIRVNAIAPGFFLTEQNRYLLTDQGTGELTSRGQQVIAHTPMGRFGQPEDLIGTLLWLVSDAAAFITGIVVPVDGGFSAFSGV
jgi:NAD(P)-dependent dehydrogenase (short-subunit alcohol dehydrogenase family)